MGFLGKHKDHKDEAPASPPVQTAPPAPASPLPSVTVNLTKGERVSLTKATSGNTTIVASNGWVAPRKDYDLKALVRYRDGRLIYVGAANDDEVLSTPEGAVRHGGDVKKGSGELETVTITWHPDIASIALSSYSALENGAGSFNEYGVFVNIQNGPQVIGINAEDASAAPNSYTLCFGEVLFAQDGGLTVTNLEEYSRPGSEYRVGYEGDQVVMDSGPVGQNK